MQDDWTYTKIGPKQRLQHSNNLGARREKAEEEEQRLPGGTRLRKKEKRRDGNHGMKCGLTGKGGNVLWRPYAPRGAQ